MSARNEKITKLNESAKNEINERKKKTKDKTI